MVVLHAVLVPPNWNVLAEPVLPHGVDPPPLLAREREGRVVAEATPVHRQPDRRGEAPVTVDVSWTAISR